MARVWALLQSADEGAVRAVQALRWSGVSWMFVLLSAWWVKGFAFVVAAAVGDVRRRQLPPPALMAVAIALPVTSLVTDALKDAFDRARPPVADPGISALVDLPGNASFPSGHASVAFAGAAALAMFHPRLAAAAVGLAAAIAVSRVYLGVHFWSDVLAGAALGIAIGAGTALLVGRVLAALRPPDRPAGITTPSPGLGARGARSPAGPPRTPG